MSADEEEDSSQASSSSDESEDIRLTGLVATRAKRQTAGNKYEVTLGGYDDPELQALFAEEDGESDEYESSQQDDDEAAMDSSSSDEDAGPPREGEAEDLAGEKELKQAERAEQNRKRKAQQAKLTVPAFAKKVKRVQLAEEARADDGSSSAIDAPVLKKKKPARISGEDGPIRQSTRASAVAFRETVSVSLQESAARSKKHKSALKETMKRERAARRTDLSLDERLEHCRGIETETAKELGRFEREEAERVRLREEALMAKRRRAVEGPQIRTFSTSALYENGKLKIMRLQHGSQSIESILQEEGIQEAEAEAEALAHAEPSDAALRIQADLVATPLAHQGTPDTLQPVGSESNEQKQPTSSLEGNVLNVLSQESISVVKAPDAPSEQQATIAISSSQDAPPEQEIEASAIKSECAENGTNAASSGEPSSGNRGQSVQAPVPWLSGIHEYAVTPERGPKQQEVDSGPAAQHPEAITSDIPLQPATSIPIAEVSMPVVREQAQRHVVILEEFPSLEAPTAKRTKAASAFEPTPIAQLLMPDSYPAFTDEEASYLKKVRKIKQELHPKQLCALTSWEGKYRDPKTGIVFADVPAYKMLQRLIAGGCNWNSMLECWSAPFVGMIGRPAAGVPDGFDVAPSES